MKTRIYGSEAGLTLVEIMMVLIILAIVMSFLGSKLVGAGDKAKRKATELKMEMLKSDIEQYQLQYNTLPSSLEALIACNDITGPGCVPVTNEESIRDAWNNFFSYSLEGTNYRIKSLGANGKDGGEGVDFDVFIIGP